MRTTAKEVWGDRIRCNTCGYLINVYKKTEVNCPQCGKYHFYTPPTTRFAFVRTVVILISCVIGLFVAYHFVDWLEKLWGF